MVVQFFDKIHRSEVAFSNFLDRFELLMEALLVEVDFEELFPLSLVLVRQLQNKQVFVAIELYGVLLDEEANFEQERNVFFSEDNHFGVNLSCYFLFGERMDNFRGVEQSTPFAE